MGTIRIGRQGEKPFNGGSITTSPEVAAPKQMSEDEKAAFIESLKKLPKDKWVSALRNAGLNEEANECERSLAEEHLHEINAKNRAKRLAEIQAMEDEEAQLQILLDEGFTDEASALAEKLAAKAEEQSAGSDGLDGKPSSTVADDEGEHTDEVKVTSLRSSPKSNPKNFPKPGRRKRSLLMRRQMTRRQSRHLQ